MDIPIKIKRILEMIKTFSIRNERVRVFLRIVLVIISLIPMLIVFNEIRTNEINLPFMDEWDQSVKISLITAEGKLQFKDLFSQHNEHRTLANNIITVLLTYFTDWDIRIQFYISFVLVICIFLFVIDIFRRSQGDKFLYLIIPSAILLFSMRQKDNWLWGFQIQWFFVVFCLFASLWILSITKFGWKPIIAVTLLAFLATFSLSSGILLWLLLALVLWFFGYRNKRYLFLWIFFTILSLIIFFQGYNSFSIGKDEAGRFVLNPLILSRYLFIYLGGPFEGYSIEISFWIGILGFALFIANLVLFVNRDRSIKPIAIWVASAGYALGSGLLTAIGRARLFLMSPSQPLTSRYVTSTTPFWLALLALIFLMETRPRWERVRPKTEYALTGINLVALVLLAGFYFRANSQMISKPWFINQKHEECVRSYPVFQNDQCLEGLYPDRSLITQKVLQLSKYGLTVFADPPSMTVIPLRNAPITLVGPQQLTQYQSYTINGEEEIVLFQHASSIVEQEIVIPRSELLLSLHFAVYVETENFKINPDIPQDGVEFVLRIIEEDGQDHLIYKRVFDPRIDLIPVPSNVDFNDYSGQLIKFVFAVHSRENPNYDWSMWVNPRIEFGENPK